MQFTQQQVMEFIRLFEKLYTTGEVATAVDQLKDWLLKVDTLNGGKTEMWRLKEYFKYRLANSEHIAAFAPIIRLIDIHQAENVNAKSISGPRLLRAAMLDDFTAMELLINTYKADVNSSETGGRTALQWAAHSGSLQMVGFLCERGAALDLPNSQGNTPLKLAMAHDAARNKADVSRCLLKWIINDEQSHSRQISKEGVSQVDKLIVAGTMNKEISNVLADFGTGSLPEGMEENERTQAVANDIFVISAMIRSLQQMLGIVVTESKEDSKRKLPKIKVAEQALLLSAKALGNSKLNSDPVEREKILDGLVGGVFTRVRDSVTRDACRSYWQRLKTKFQSLSLPAEADAQQSVIDAALEAVERPTAVVTVQNSSITAVRETKEREQKQSIDSSSSETTHTASSKIEGGDSLSTTPISSSSTVSTREVIVGAGDQPSMRDAAGDKKVEELAQAGKEMLLTEATADAEVEHFNLDWWWDPPSPRPGSGFKLTRQNATAGSLLSGQSTFFPLPGLSGPSSFLPVVEGITSVKAYFTSPQGGDPPGRSHGK